MFLLLDKFNIAVGQDVAGAVFFVVVDLCCFKKIFIMLLNLFTAGDFR